MYSYRLVLSRGNNSFDPSPYFFSIIFAGRNFIDTKPRALVVVLLSQLLIFSAELTCMGSLGVSTIPPCFKKAGLDSGYLARAASKSSVLDVFCVMLSMYIVGGMNGWPVRLLAAVAGAGVLKFVVSAMILLVVPCMFDPGVEVCFGLIVLHDGEMLMFAARVSEGVVAMIDCVIVLLVVSCV